MHIAVGALLKCPTVEQAAQVSEIPVSTLRRWRQRPEFAAKLCDAQAEILQGAINELRGAGADAARTLASIVRDSNAPAAARVRASIAVVNLLLKAHDAEVLEFRLRRLEAQHKLKRPGGSLGRH
jgi:hypothetical protein